VNPQIVSPPVAFDLFGTLVAVDDPPDPATAIADELAARGVAVPADWTAAYGEPHIDADDGAELPLPAHVQAALASRGIDAAEAAVRRAVTDAFAPGETAGESSVETRNGAVDAVVAAGERGPVGLLSNCSVPGLVDRTLQRSTLDREQFDAIVTSVGCGWRKPDPRAFETLADRLSVAASDLVVVGDTAATDGGIVDCGGEFVDIADTPVSKLSTRFSEGRRCR
jgi:FMN phosphatase YigB (HAD superfamily)